LGSRPRVHFLPALMDVPLFWHGTGSCVLT
jgi:hypothetical protein